jgi:hypothetical protein
MLRNADRIPFSHGVAFAALCLVCGLAVLQCSNWHRREAMRLTAVRAESTRQAERKRSEDAQASVRKQQHARYVSLQQRGVIGPPQRIAWVEAVRSAGHRARIPGFEYELGPAQGLPANPGEQTAYLSAMQIRLQLAHESQLLDFLRELESPARWLFRFDGCEVKRLAERASATLEARCALMWINIQPSSGAVA